jgi:hypothetical protein
MAAAPSPAWRCYYLAVAVLPQWSFRRISGLVCLSLALLCLLIAFLYYPSPSLYVFSSLRHLAFHIPPLPLVFDLYSPNSSFNCASCSMHPLVCLTTSPAHPVPNFVGCDVFTALVEGGLATAVEETQVWILVPEHLVWMGNSYEGHGLERNAVGISFGGLQGSRTCVIGIA